MKSTPIFEKIIPEFGNSLNIKQYHTNSRNKKPYWHIHPELELVYVNGGTGKRHIGNQLSYFNDGDLILLGSNLPHYGFTDSLTNNKSETIIHMPHDFPGSHFMQLPELVSIKKLFERAKRGVVFFGKTKLIAGKRMEKLASLDPFDRILELLSILKLLALSKETEVLNIDNVVIEIKIQDNDRINRIFDFVRENFQESISLERISDHVSMAVPSFCRYFKKMAGKTFTQFVNEYRIVHSIKLLSEKNASITDICLESGFGNFSHFNKCFKSFTGMSPSRYRNELTQVHH